jgi:hypothetical protein
MTELADDLTALKDQYRFDQWARRLDESLLVWNLWFSGNELPGWQITRTQDEDIDDQVRYLEAWWRPEDEQSAQLVRVDVIEATSQHHAREQLLMRLSRIQEAPLEQVTSDTLGDVAFSSPENEAVFFLRANLAMVVRAANPLSPPVRNIATIFDAWLINKEPVERGVPPHIEAFRAEVDGPNQLGNGVRLHLRVTDRLDRPISYKLYAHHGELALIDTTPIYYPTASGTDEITLIAISADGSTASRTLSLETSTASEGGEPPGH